MSENMNGKNFNDDDLSKYFDIIESPESLLIAKGYCVRVSGKEGSSSDTVCYYH